MEVSKMKNWILIIDSLNGILTDSIANKEIAYTCNDASKIMLGDRLLGYISMPIGEIRMLLTATKNGNGTTLFLEKLFEVSFGCKVTDDLYNKVLATSSTENKCVEISEEEYNELTRAFFENIQNSQNNFLGQSSLPKHNVFNNNVYGIHIKKQNDALSKDRSHICIGWSGMGDLSALNTREDINNRHADTYPEATTNSRGQDVGQIHRFKNEAQLGDYVVFAEQNVCHIGKITSEYYYDASKYPGQSEDYVNVRNVEWLKTNIKRSDLSVAFRSSLGAGMSFWGLNDYKSVVYELLNDTYVKDVIELTDDIAVLVDGKIQNYTVEELGTILTQMYNDATSGNQSNAIRMFGVKYGGVIIANDYSAASIVKASGINNSYDAEVSKGISIYKSIKNNEYGIHFVGEDIVSEAPKKQKELPSLPKRTRKLFELNSILYGAPGTGKTYATAKYALAVIEGKELEEYKDVPREEIMSKYNQLITNGQVVFTTFHQNYGYEDFIQGIRPDTTNAEMRFRTVDGVFKQIAEKAMEAPEKDFVIIIDEINRANISKVFGELITLIEDDKRWGEENAVSATLPSGEIFAVPNNLYIVGTMNSADKSISLIDTALRRRFEFVEFVPDLNLISDTKLKKVLEKLNDGISKELNSTDLLVGHSYFINKKADDICTIMNRSIIPLLYEYFFDNKNKVEVQLKSALEGLDVEVVSNTMGRIKIKKKEV